MSTAEFHDDDELSDEIEGEDEVSLDELPDIDGAAIAIDDDDEEEDDEDLDDESVSDDDAPDAADEDDDGDEDDEAEESLDVLLAREKVLDEDDLGRITEEPRTGLNVRPALVGAGEFTCRSCFLVKRRAQLADEKRLLCFDCV